ncbi:MAG: GHKL domain-containing protein [Clostridia bacterium]|nr:GHKL domain-containing protein [Clostridia bacterium]
MNIAVLCVTELLKNASGFFTGTFLLKRLFGYDIKIKKAAFVVTAFVFAVASLLPFAVFEDTYAAADICDIVTMLGFIVFPYLCFSSRKKLTFFWYGIILNSTADFMILMVSLFFKTDNQATFNLLYIILYAALSAAVFIITKQRIPVYHGAFFEKIPTLVYVVILIADLATYYAVTLTRDSAYIEDVANVLLVLSAVLVVSCIVFIVSKYFSVSEKQSNVQLLLNTQVLHNEEIIKSNTDIRRFKHDYINNIFALSTLIDQNRIEEAKEYLAKMNELPALTKTKYSTGNYLADAIISAKATAAQEKELRIEFEGTIPSQRISNNDICTIIANVLDNAVFNSPQKSLTPITISSVEQSNGCILTVSNPVSKPVEIKNNKIQTSKKDKTNHGFGLDNIKAVAKEYNGFVNLTCENNLFIIEIGLMFKEENSYEKAVQIFE